MHCAEVESFVDIARRAGIVGSAEADQYVFESKRSAEVVGLRAADVPGSVAELQEYFAEIRPQLYACKEAKQGLINALNPPIPFPWTGLRLAGPPMVSLAFGSLPRWARRLFGVPIALPTTDLAITGTLFALRQATRPLRRDPAQFYALGDA